jgi:hypothetical protein
MSNISRFEFALHEPAMAIARVFSPLQKAPGGGRRKLDIRMSFGGSELHWRSPDALGIPEQSVFLGLLSIGGQQPYRLQVKSPGKEGKRLLTDMEICGIEEIASLTVVKASWKLIARAAGYKTTGGKNVVLVKNAVKRLAETTLWEKTNSKEYQSRLLSWIVGDDDGVTIVLNRRATEALCGGQYVKISLRERHALRSQPAKALHAWLSSALRTGSERRFNLSRLQEHVWAGEASGSTSSTRVEKLKLAIKEIGGLPGWHAHVTDDGIVTILRKNK